MIVVGIALTFVVGLCWALVGVFYKMMAKWNVSVFTNGLITGSFNVIIVAFAYTKFGALISGSVEAPTWNFILFIAAAGLLNSGGCLILQRSMIYGKSSVTWAIGQSAFIMPFVLITIFYGENWDPFKVIGSAAVLAGMIFLCMKPEAKGEKLPRAGYGLFLALVSFVLIGIAQTMTSMSSYLVYKDPGNLRPILFSFGGILATVGGKVALKDKGFYFNKKVILLIILVIMEGVLANCVQFAAMDQLAKYQMNAVFFPIAIGLCIGGYAVFSWLFFKEKQTKAMRGGTVCILVGVLCFCYAAFRTIA